MWIFFSGDYINFDNVSYINVSDTCIRVYCNSASGHECFKTKKECADRWNQIWGLIIKDSKNPDLYLAVPKDQIPKTETVEGEKEYDWQN